MNKTITVTVNSSGVQDEQYALMGLLMKMKASDLKAVLLELRKQNPRQFKQVMVSCHGIAYAEMNL